MSKRRTVEPIRDKEKIKDISSYLRASSESYYILFMLGIHTGLRISDLLKLRVRDIKGKSDLYMTAQKTGKEIRLPIHKTLYREIDNFISERQGFEYLFKSREGLNKPITPKTAWLKIKKAGEYFGVYRLGTHSMRKTFGYHFYLSSKDIAHLMSIFGHSDPNKTLRYIGITTQENFDLITKHIDFY